ncbi:type IV secretion system DNA-binding domain-containing protein [Zhongshania borealis]|uniref:Type IV secretion system coupling protein TraD DNA-binding domain-containing protein n=1 Tax=Zhongshania borealis TaxID=889488 RepID=A0ABP7W9S5_9GAMM
MTNQNLAPTQRRQHWASIWVIFGIVFTTIFSGLSIWSWDWVTGWGSLQEHWPFTQVKDLRVMQMWQHQARLYWKDYIAHHDLQLHFAGHVGIPALLALIPAIFCARFAYVPGGYDLIRHIAGARRYEYKQAIKHAQRKLKEDCKVNATAPGLFLHPKLAIPRRGAEEQNLLLVGGQGAGKTVLVRPLIKQVRERNARMFIYDEKKEFTSWFLDQHTILIAPWDVRSKPWNIAADATTSQAAMLIAECMITLAKGDNAVFSKGARLLFCGMIIILNSTRTQWGWEELAELLSTSETDLLKLLEQHYPRTSSFIMENSRTTQGFFIDIATELDFIHELSKAWPTAYVNGFSITLWAANESSTTRTVIVQADKRFRHIGAPLCSAMIGLMTATILSQENSFSRELFLFLDELANLKPTPYLLEWLSLGRSKGCRCIAGTQSVSALQTDEMYGEKGTDALLSLFGLFIALRMSGIGKSAKYCAEAFDARQVERPNSSAGPQNTPIDNWHGDSQALVTSADLIQKLPQPGRRGVHGFLLVPGWGVYKLRWPLNPLPQVAKEHIPAVWLSAKPKVTSPENDTARRGRRR